jgi:3-phenylpropionate/trans-cinnamate dioxygenase ferredoxin reductase subunit
MEHKIRDYHIKGIFWISLYLFITLAPLFIVLIGMEDDGRGFWTEFSVALGFVGLTMLALQFILTARFSTIEAPYGIDMIIEFHKQISLVACIFIIIHPAILMFTDSRNLQLLNPLTAPFRALMGLTSLFSLLIIVVISIFRKELNIGYEIWKTLHGILAIVAVITAFLHIIGVSHYLSNIWKQAFWGAILIAAIATLLYIRIIKPWYLKNRAYIINDIKEERGDTWTIEFKPNGHKGIDFKPGQFAWLTLGNSPFKIEEHPFSFSSSAENGGTFTMTIKELGDFTGKVEEFKKGDKAFIDGPYGVFTPDRFDGYSGLVLIAGGIGVTPIMSILKTLSDRKSKCPILFFYASEDLESITFYEEIEDIKKKLDIEVIHILKETDDNWEGESGYLDEEKIEKYLPEDFKSRIYFLCGPDPMMEQVEVALEKKGVPVGSINMEHFDLV